MLKIKIVFPSAFKRIAPYPSLLTLIITSLYTLTVSYSYLTLYAHSVLLLPHFIRSHCLIITSLYTLTLSYSYLTLYAHIVTVLAHFT